MCLPTLANQGSQMYFLIQAITTTKNLYILVVAVGPNPAITSRLSRNQRFISDYDTIETVLL